MEINTEKGYAIKTVKNDKLSKILGRFSAHKSQEQILTNADEERVLIESIREAKNDWVNANTCFEYANDQEMVDYYTYKIKACQVRYEYYLKKAKEKGVKITSSIENI